MAWTERDRSIMGDVYRIMQRFSVIPMQEPENTEYWSLLTTTLNEFVTKWGMDHLTINAAVFISTWLQDVYKEKRDAAMHIEEAKAKYCECAEPNMSIHHENGCGKPGQPSDTIISPTSSPDALDGCKNKYTDNKTDKKGAIHDEHTDADPRICDGMLCFL